MYNNKHGHFLHLILHDNIPVTYTEGIGHRQADDTWTETLSSDHCEQGSEESNAVANKFQPDS